MKPLKEKISITIDSDLLEKIREKAEYDDRSLSQYINIILKQHIRDTEANEKPWVKLTAYFNKVVLLYGN